ncbi:MAG: FG-GAP repeat protein [Planctomycetota bacterium]
MPPSLAAAHRRAAEEEGYRVSPGDAAGAWTAANPAQGFRAAFSGAGLEIAGTGADGSPWRLGLRLAAWGRSEELAPVLDGTVHAGDRRVEIRRGDLVEWYGNDERGVEQGFTIACPPLIETGADGELRLRLTVVGSFSFEVQAGERDARFWSADGEMDIRYAGLRAWDGAGSELPARLVASAGDLSLLIEDVGAVYPVTVDPWIWTQETKLTAGDGGPNDYFGSDVSLNGDTALIGADSDNTSSGSAYVFVRTGSTWIQQAKLVASDATAYDYFGSGVSVEGDTALIGAPCDDDLGSYSGSAYVFLRSGTTWSQQVKLTASDGGANARFGQSVSLSGDTVLIGAWGDDHAGSYSGAAYVFVRSGTAWTPEAKLTASDAGADRRFGMCVSLEGNTALVGASQWGYAYVFVRSGTVWSEQAKFLGAGGSTEDAVSLSGDTALAGNAWESSTAGAAYVYVRSGSSWSQQARLVPSDVADDDGFGWATSLDGDTALIASKFDDDMGSASGAAYVFVRSGTIWSQQAKITPGDGATEDYFGCSVSLDGQTALIGSYFDDDRGLQSGSAYAFVYTPFAHAAPRNAGTNPASHTAVTLPVLGATYTATVDLAGTTGHSLAWLVGYCTPITLPLGGGQTLLVNIADPNGELLGQAFLPGPLATYNLPVPADPAFAGFPAATQALHIGGVQPWALSNAQDLFLGY